MPGFSLVPVAGALGLYHVRRYPQRDLPVGRTCGRRCCFVSQCWTMMSIAEEPRGLGARVGDQGLGPVEFQSEGLPEELRQPGLDLLGFGLRPDKSQDMVVGIT